MAHGKSGYVQRPFNSHGRSLRQRTFMLLKRLAKKRDRDRDREREYYQNWRHGNRELNFYARQHFYKASFYRWADTPFDRPYPYQWVADGGADQEATATLAQPDAFQFPHSKFVKNPKAWLAEYVLTQVYEAAAEDGSVPALAQIQPGHLLYYSAALVPTFTASALLGSLEDSGPAGCRARSARRWRMKCSTSCAWRPPKRKGTGPRCPPSSPIRRPGCFWWSRT